jgi:uncharacterized membrane protein YvlD (DUF360 family)
MILSVSPSSIFRVGLFMFIWNLYVTGMCKEILSASINRYRICDFVLNDIVVGRINCYV